MAEEMGLSCAVGTPGPLHLVVADRTSTIVWETDSQLRVTSCGGAGLAGVHLRADQVRGMTLGEYFQSDDPEIRPIAAHRRALRGESVSCEFAWAGRSHRLHVSPLRNGHRQIIGCTGVAQQIAPRRTPQRAGQCERSQATRDDLERLLQQRAAELAVANQQLRDEAADRRLAERALLERDRWVNGVFRNMPVVAFMLDRDGCFQECFGAGLACLGWKDNELIGHSAMEVFPQSRHWFQRALSGENVHFQSQGIVDGKLWAFENFVAFDTLYGCGAVGFAIDITEHRQVEQQGEKLRADLAHMARVQTMGEMASGMAHELNQPLAAVVMWAEVAAQKIRLGKQTGNDEVLKVLDDIAGQTYRAGEIIRRMKDFVRKTEPHRTTVDVSEIIGEALPLVASDLRHAGIVLDGCAEPPLPKILVDRVQVQQVLLNLIRNAIEAMEDMAADQRRLRIEAQARDRVVEITVSDTGRGIPKDQLDCLFGAFYSTKFDGMGMGLAISRSIIEAHGGRIWAISTPQQGTSFTFTLPIPSEEEKNGI